MCSIQEKSTHNTRLGQTVDENHHVIIKNLLSQKKSFHLLI